jgi:hypothetical protein
MCNRSDYATNSTGLLSFTYIPLNWCIQRDSFTYHKYNDCRYDMINDTYVYTESYFGNATCTEAIYDGFTLDYVVSDSCQIANTTLLSRLGSLPDDTNTRVVCAKGTPTASPTYQPTVTMRPTATPTTAPSDASQYKSPKPTAQPTVAPDSRLVTNSHMRNAFEACGVNMSVYKNTSVSSYFAHDFSLGYCNMYVNHSSCVSDADYSCTPSCFVTKLSPAYICNAFASLAQSCTELMPAFSSINVTMAAAAQKTCLASYLEAVSTYSTESVIKLPISFELIGVSAADMESDEVSTAIIRNVIAVLTPGVYTISVTYADVTSGSRKLKAGEQMETQSTATTISCLLSLYYDLFADANYSSIATTMKTTLSKVFDDGTFAALAISAIDQQLELQPALSLTLTTSVVQASSSAFSLVVETTSTPYSPTVYPTSTPTSFPSFGGIVPPAIPQAVKSPAPVALISGITVGGAVFLGLVSFIVYQLTQRDKVHGNDKKIPFLGSMKPLFEDDDVFISNLAKEDDEVDSEEGGSVCSVRYQHENRDNSAKAKKKSHSPLANKFDSSNGIDDKSANAEKNKNGSFVIDEHEYSDGTDDEKNSPDNKLLSCEIEMENFLGGTKETQIMTPLTAMAGPTLSRPGSATARKSSQVLPVEFAIPRVSSRPTTAQNNTQLHQVYPDTVAPATVVAALLSVDKSDVTGDASVRPSSAVDASTVVPTVNAHSRPTTGTDKGEPSTGPTTASVPVPGGRRGTFKLSNMLPLTLLGASNQVSTGPSASDSSSLSSVVPGTSSQAGSKAPGAAKDIPVSPTRRMSTTKASVASLASVDSIDSLAANSTAPPKRRDSISSKERAEQTWKIYGNPAALVKGPSDAGTNKKTRKTVAAINTSSPSKNDANKSNNASNTAPIAEGSELGKGVIGEAAFEDLIEVPLDQDSTADLTMSAIKVAGSNNGSRVPSRPATDRPLTSTGASRPMTSGNRVMDDSGSPVRVMTAGGNTGFVTDSLDFNSVDNVDSVDLADGVQRFEVSSEDKNKSPVVKALPLVVDPAIVSKLKLKDPTLNKELAPSQVVANKGVSTSIDPQDGTMQIIGRQTIVKRELGIDDEDSLEDDSYVSYSDAAGSEGESLEEFSDDGDGEGGEEGHDRLRPMHSRTQSQVSTQSRGHRNHGESDHSTEGRKTRKSRRRSSGKKTSKVGKQESSRQAGNPVPVPGEDSAARIDPNVTSSPGKNNVIASVMGMGRPVTADNAGSSKKAGGGFVTSSNPISRFFMNAFNGESATSSAAVGGDGKTTISEQVDSSIHVTVPQRPLTGDSPANSPRRQNMSSASDNSGEEGTPTGTHVRKKSWFGFGGASSSGDDGRKLSTAAGSRTAGSGSSPTKANSEMKVKESTQTSPVATAVVPLTLESLLNENDEDKEAAFNSNLAALAAKSKQTTGQLRATVIAKKNNVDQMTSYDEAVEAAKAASEHKDRDVVVSAAAGAYGVGLDSKDGDKPVKVSNNYFASVAGVQPSVSSNTPASLAKASLSLVSIDEKQSGVEQFNNSILTDVGSVTSIVSTATNSNDKKKQRNSTITKRDSKASPSTPRASSISKAGGRSSTANSKSSFGGGGSSSGYDSSSPSPRARPVAKKALVNPHLGHKQNRAHGNTSDSDHQGGLSESELSQTSLASSSVQAKINAQSPHRYERPSINSQNKLKLVKDHRLHQLKDAHK